MTELEIPTKIEQLFVAETVLELRVRIEGLKNSV